MRGGGGSQTFFAAAGDIQAKPMHVSGGFDLLVFYETGRSDVTPISPPVGVISQIKWQTLKGNCRLPISGSMQCILYCAPFSSY